MKKRILFISLCLMILSFGIHQSNATLLTKAETPSFWKTSFPRGINWQRMTDVGILVVSTDDALYGLNPENGQKLWQHEFLKKLKEERYDPIENSPLVALVDKRGLMSMDHVILDVVSGKVLCNTGEMGFRTVEMRTELPPLGGILFLGLNKYGKKIMTLVDAGDGHAKFTQELKDFGGTEMFAGRPFVMNGDILVVSNKAIFRFNGQTGEKVWEIEQKSPNAEVIVDKSAGLGASMANSLNPKFRYFTQIRPGRDKNSFFYTSKKYVNSFDFATGKALWADPVKVGGEIVETIYDNGGFIVATDDPEIIMLDYQNGTRLWGKGPKLKGTLSFYNYCDKGLLISMESSRGKNSLSILDLKTGQHVFDKPNKVDGQIVDLQLTPKGIFYRTTEEVNFQSLETGKDLWDKSLKLKEGNVACQKDYLQWIYSDKKLFEVNLQSASMKEFVADKVKLNEKEAPSGFQVRNDGILLTSSQNLVKFGFAGNVMYSQYFHSPTASTAGKIFGGIMAVGGTMLAVAAAANAGYAKGATAGGGRTYEVDSYIRQQEQAQQMWSAVASAGFAMMNKRFKASAQTENYQAILTDDANDGSQKGVGLVKVNKDNGKVEATVILGDKKPVYDLDEIGGLMYYRSKDNEITAFKF
ncbi:outer membrane protein assembly factor BamB family protein [Arcicella lustrica]|uniref:PQQ-binding-like beta-propeller repeat protein n=1 Tax=Arcicella lustrica TaxID=2984196 RepID=A0ABU5SE41_9BACT|nr:PQQ-binding-like beta-propeller repeat protein [Arcicella sp. DC25W]MEA5425549.1 PQQ-binding-like beta-propeller repeat protein [Arcicella sp. DC25W]